MKKKKETRWNSCNEVIVTKSSKEEIEKLKEESFKRLENFVENGTKRKD